MPSEESNDQTDEKETGRLEAFSDGVFGIAMTLLVLELKVPTLAQLNPSGGPPTSRALFHFLAHQWPGYFAFFTSFFTVLVMWVHHHSLFRLIRKVDALLLFANGALLLLVTFVPFPTAILAQFLMTPAAKAAAAFYGATFVLVALCFFALLRAAFRSHLLAPTAPRQILKKFRDGYYIGPPAYLLATLSAFISAWVCIGICTILWIYWFLATIDWNATERQTEDVEQTLSP